MKKRETRRDSKRSKKRLVGIIAACAAVVVVAAVLVPQLVDSDTVRIRDWHDLNRVRDDLAGSYLLVQDLDSTTAGYDEVAGPTANDGRGWEPIGQAHFLEEGIVGEPFDGTFDGGGHEIRDLFIGRSDENTVGLFGIVGEGAAVRDLGIVGANVTGHFSVGVLASMNLGSVSNSYSTGSVIGHSGVGGLLGGNGYGATVSNSYSDASVTGVMVAGGLVGMNGHATVRDSYATGSVTRARGRNVNFGGFVGRNLEGMIVNCYSTGSVHFPDEEGPAEHGFAGSVVTDGGYKMTGNYWDVETSGQGGTAGDATGLTTAEMMDPATYEGWSIRAVDGPGRRNTAYTWNMVEGETYPFLSWQPRS